MMKQWLGTGDWGLVNAPAFRAERMSGKLLP
jgi:hypothetical protein